VGKSGGNSPDIQSKTQKKYMLQKMHCVSAARALLPNLRMHASLSRVVLSKYEDSVQVFGAFTGFL
jgi:hypothetical protein